MFVADDIATEDVPKIMPQVVQEPGVPIEKSESGKCRPMSLFLLFTTGTKINRGKVNS